MSDWFLLILTLPTANTNVRMRAWRALKNGGAAVLRDGVYLLPKNDINRDIMAKVAADVQDSEGKAWLLEPGNSEQYPFTELFDRSEEYQLLLEDLRQLQESVAALSENEVMRQVRKLRKHFESIVCLDFFPGDTQLQTRSQLDEISRQLQSRFSPDEPSGHAGSIQKLSIKDYQDRSWATRKNMWVDRVASAWLIKRFIDPEANFIWLDSPADCPESALGFDFDDARFTHVHTASGELVSFENLMLSFGLEQDPALKRFAKIVHALDVGGLPVDEAAGFESLLGGMRKRIQNDDELLQVAESVFNDFYLSFQQESPHE